MISARQLCFANISMYHVCEKKKYIEPQKKKKNKKKKLKRRQREVEQGRIRGIIYVPKWSKITAYRLQEEGAKRLSFCPSQIRERKDEALSQPSHIPVVHNTLCGCFLHSISHFIFFVFFFCSSPVITEHGWRRHNMLCDGSMRSNRWLKACTFPSTFRMRYGASVLM